MTKIPTRCWNLVNGTTNSCRHQHHIFLAWLYPCFYFGTLSLSGPFVPRHYTPPTLQNLCTLVLPTPQAVFVSLKMLISITATTIQRKHDTFDLLFYRFFKYMDGMLPPPRKKLKLKIKINPYLWILWWCLHIHFMGYLPPNLIKVCL